MRYKIKRFFINAILIVLTVPAWPFLNFLSRVSGDVHLRVRFWVFIVPALPFLLIGIPLVFELDAMDDRGEW